jgi:hypothetical protein
MRQEESDKSESKQLFVVTYTRLQSYSEGVSRLLDIQQIFLLCNDLIALVEQASIESVSLSRKISRITHTSLHLSHCYNEHKAFSTTR